MLEQVLRIRNNFDTFVMAMYDAMTTRIIKIGNSKGLVLPASLLKKYAVQEKDEVRIQEEDGRIMLTFPGREAPFTGPFTGPFAGLAPFAPDLDDTRDALDIARELHDARGNTRETPTW